MTKDMFSDLLKVTRAGLLAQQRRAKPGLEKIRKLRAEQAAIHELDRESRPSAELDQVRAFGADVLWQSWLGRQRRDLNLQLARVLSEQDHVMRDLKKAQGRHDSLSSVVEHRRAHKKRLMSFEREARLLEAGLLFRRDRT